MPPRFGTGECGFLCDDSSRWCGCFTANDDWDGDCEGKGRHFAVYAMPDEKGHQSATPRNRPLWKLDKGDNGVPLLEVVAPPGRTLQADGRHVVVATQSPEDSENADASHLGRVEVPVDLEKHDCSFADNGKKMNCRLQENTVQELQVRYTDDEL